MPNWCTNILEITGPEDSIDQFIAASTTDGETLSFALLVPEPPQVSANVDTSRLLDWRIDHGWGTKWDVGEGECDLLLEPGLAVWSFSTAWGPPLRWLENVAPQWEALEFRLGYDEPGMAFSGVQCFQKGAHNPQASWEGDSFSGLVCAAGTCETYIYDSGISFMDFTSAPTSSDLTVFCPEHALEEAVYEHHMTDKPDA